MTSEIVWFLLYWNSAFQTPRCPLKDILDKIIFGYLCQIINNFGAHSCTELAISQGWPRWEIQHSILGGLVTLLGKLDISILWRISLTALVSGLKIHIYDSWSMT